MVAKQEANEKMILNERWMEVDGLRIRYLQGGSGPPLLLIHGLLGGSFEWRFILPVLAQQYSVHAVDLPGAGLSHDTGIDCSMSCQADRMARFIEKMGWAQWSVLGASLGGAVAMLLAAKPRLSEQIRSLVLSAPVNPWSNFGQDRIDLLCTRLGGYILPLLMPISRPYHGKLVSRMYGDPRRMPKDALDGYRGSVLRPGRARNVLTTLRKWKDDVESLRTFIPQLRVPTLLIWGSRDRAVDPNSANLLLQQLPNSELVVIPGAGHLVFEETPDDFNRIVLAFLGRFMPATSVQPPRMVT